MTLLDLAVTILAIVTFGYIGVCAANPFATCRKCEGLGFELKTTRRGKPKRGRDCRRCKTTGARIRTGRHLWNLWRRTYRQGTR